MNEKGKRTKKEFKLPVFAFVHRLRLRACICTSNMCDVCENRHWTWFKFRMKFCYSLLFVFHYAVIPAKSGTTDGQIKPQLDKKAIVGKLERKPSKQAKFGRLR